MQTLTYGTHTIDPATLPAASIDALLRRGFAHFLGNEVASKVTAAKAKAAEGDTPAPLTDDAIAALKASLQAEAIEALTSGTVGVASPRAPRQDPVDSIMRTRAKAEVLGILKHNQLKAPRGEEKVSFPNGDAFTMAELVSRRIANHGERLRAEAEKELRSREKLGAKEGIEAL